MLRGVALSVTSATLAVAAHTAGGGMAPDTGLTVLLTVGVAALGVALAGERRSTAAILAVLSAAQLGTHVLLSLGSMDMPAHVDGLAMLGAHALAVLGTAVLLARADDAVFLAAAVLARLLPVLLVPPPVPRAPARAHRPRTRQRDRRATILTCRRHAHRGPPAIG